MDAVAAVGLIRIAAAEVVLEPWQRPSDAWLVELGLDALMADVEAPSLPLLAGLARGEYTRARELFGHVVDELGLLPQGPEELAEARWTAARWWAAEIVAHQIDPVRGAVLIRDQAAELGYPDVLRALVDLAWAVDPADDRRSVREGVPEGVLAAAREFLAAEERRNHRP
ncbi:hypothetical protein [Streptomyces fructofermentans]|uniref:Uncharacterized protein n=1 Tax=Streptomyces fructofermentans TaxID=152141 RepID=A0A918KUB3_9ACTN|nr:hypothetical protein [Streptomyces fructofermentans]GGX76566.1 hypothetical protein GCM10010515_50540 [Streptomyces fructofermentans]